MGTALAVDHAVQIFSAEHFAEPVHEWTCAAAPLHDPETGERIGVIDLSGELSTAHPHTLALVESAARLIESMTLRDRREAAERRRERSKDEGAGYLLARPRRDTARPTKVEALGRDRARISIGGRTVSLSRRHSELLLTLHLRPGGMTAEEIAIAVWGERAKPVSARAELSRLRRILGPRLEAQPYRLRCEIAGDFEAVRAAIAAGRLGDALDRYSGPLLPRSEVPIIVEARQMLDGELRSALLAGGDPVLLGRWLSHPAGEDDAVVCRELLSLLPEGDRRRPAALAHLRRITSGSGTAGS